MPDSSTDQPTVDQRLVTPYRKTPRQLELDAGPAAAAVYAYLSSLPSGRRHAFALPSHNTIATETGLGRRSILRHLQRLEKLGWISGERRPGYSTVYHLHDPPIVEGGTPIWRRGPANLAEGVRQTGAGGAPNWPAMDVHGRYEQGETNSERRSGGAALQSALPGTGPDQVRPFKPGGARIHGPTPEDLAELPHGDKLPPPAWLTKIDEPLPYHPHGRPAK